MAIKRLPGKQVGTDSIGTLSVDVYVDEVGKFRGMFDGKVFEATSRKGLLAKIKKHVDTNARVLIEVTVFEEPHWSVIDDDEQKQPIDECFTDLTLTGVDERRGYSFPILIDNDGGRVPSNQHAMYRRLTNEQREQIAAAFQEHYNTEKRYRDLLDSLRLVDWREAVEQAEQPQSTK